MATESSKQGEALSRQLAQIKAFAEERRDVEPAWLTGLRTEAARAFEERGWPGTKEERWRFTNVRGIVGREHVRATAPDGTPELESHDLVRETRQHRLVFVNGCHAPELSSPGELPAGVHLRSLGTLLAEEPDRLEPHLGRYATRFGENPFTALNTVFFEDGALLEIEPGVELEDPVVLIHLAVPGTESEAPVSYPRTLLVAGEGSRAMVVEHYTGGGETPALTNAVTEVLVAGSAELRHYRVQDEATALDHVSATQVHHSGEHGVYDGKSIVLGGRLTRNDVTTVLDASHVESTIDGLYLAADDQLIDNHTRIEHRAPDTVSHELYKGVLSGNGRAVFNGRIFVDRIAQRTDAYQSNPNLLLSDDAVANSNPELEIYADDVKCSHGATYGNLDPMMKFYLRTRGIPEARAESLMIYAFAADVLDRITLEELRDRLEAILFGRLRQAQDAEAPRQVA